MNIRQLNKLVTSKTLNETLAKKFGTKIDVDSFTLEQLQDARNKMRTKQFDIETNESFNGLSQNRTYSKNKLFLDVLNAAISERSDIAETQSAAQKAAFQKMLAKKKGAKPAAKDDNQPDKKKDAARPFDKEKDGKGVGAAGKPDLNKDGKNDFKDVQIARRNASAKDTKVKEGDGIYHDCAKKFEHKVYGECTVLPGEHTLLEDGTVTHYDATFIKEGETYIVRNVAVKDMRNVVSEGHTHASKSKRKKAKMESIIKEGAEDHAELIMAAKDMVDRLTGWMEDTAEMQTESMLELADAIRDEMGAQQSEGFTNAVKPALEQLYAAMESTRIALTGGVGMLTGEGEAPAEDMGVPVDGDVGMAADVDGEADMEPTVDTDEFAAAAPAAGGEAEAGRERRESRMYAKKKMIETSRRLGSILSKTSSK
jgi:hypothetical protein